jgi:hypothetical protein
MHQVRPYTPDSTVSDRSAIASPWNPTRDLRKCAGTNSAIRNIDPMTDREAKSRAVKILAKSIYRDLESQGFDEKQIIALATELISEVTTKMSRGSSPAVAVPVEKQLA